MQIVIDIPDVEKDKATLLKLLAEENTQVLATAYMYARNFITYGVDVTKEWDTAVRQTEALNIAYLDGYREGYRSGRNEYCIENTPTIIPADKEVTE